MYKKYKGFYQKIHHRWPLHEKLNSSLGPTNGVRQPDFIFILFFTLRGMTLASLISEGGDASISSRAYAKENIRVHIHVHLLRVKEVENFLFK